MLVGVFKVVAWHQDAGLRPDGGPNYAPESERENAFGLDAMVNAWMPLVHATRRNGAMKFVPGTHKLGFVVVGESEHYKPKKNPSVQN